MSFTGRRNGETTRKDTDRVNCSSLYGDRRGDVHGFHKASWSCGGVAGYECFMLAWGRRSSYEVSPHFGRLFLPATM